MKPTMAVMKKPSPRVRFFSQIKDCGVVFTSPVAGKVASINRGAKRAFISVVIEVAGDSAQTFESYDAAALQRWTGRRSYLRCCKAAHGRLCVLDHFLESLRLKAHPIPFATAMDSNPLAADPKPIIAAERRELAGLTIGADRRRCSSMPRCFESAQGV